MEPSLGQEALRLDSTDRLTGPVIESTFEAIDEHVIEPFTETNVVVRKEKLVLESIQNADQGFGF